MRLNDSDDGIRLVTPKTGADDTEAMKAFARQRLFAYCRLIELFTPGWKPKDLIRSHTAHKLTVMAHSPMAYKEIGQLVAGCADVDRATMEADYRHRIMGGLDADTRRDLLASIEDYGAGLVPLIVPLTLLRHYVERLKISYLRGQAYLDLHPKELMLRNQL